jgi:hypothetical protein
VLLERLGLAGGPPEHRPHVGHEAVQARRVDDELVGLEARRWRGEVLVVGDEGGHDGILRRLWRRYRMHSAGWQSRAPPDPERGWRLRARPSRSRPAVILTCLAK